MKTISIIFFLVIATLTTAQELKPAMDIKLKGKVGDFQIKLVFCPEGKLLKRDPETSNEMIDMKSFYLAETEITTSQLTSLMGIEFTDENIKVLTKRLEEVAYQEIERGVSLIGPHRDDLHLQLGDFPAKGYASHGESWSMAISLRIGSFNLLKTEGSEPILILDDVFAELDTSRRVQLMSATQIAEQTIITAAVEGDLPGELLTKKYYVTPGAVRKGTS